MLKIANCGLLRTPKVYNALITTDENISPSRSFPIIQPHIHETGLAYPAYPFSNYNPFSLYDSYSPFSDGPAINPSFISRNNVPSGYSLTQQRNHFGVSHADDLNSSSDNNQSNEEQQKQDENSNQSPSQSNEPNSSPQQQQEHQNQITDDSPKQPDNSLAPNGMRDKSPIPLNEFGLPPSLIPIGPYGNNNYPVVQQNPINLAPYAYNSYPLAFDQFNGYQPNYQPNPYLPPFGYYPQPLDFSQLPPSIHNNRRFSKSGNTPHHQPLPNVKPTPPQKVPAQPPHIQHESTTLTGEPSSVIPLDDIKNFANKNKDIPDVPPPPLPSGAKKIPADE